jgi:ribosome biogenesis protein MAK21
MKLYNNLSEKGTLKDKIMALNLIIKKDPISSLPYVRQMLKMAHKKDRKQAFIAIDSLQEVFTKTLLPEDRKLKTFKQAVEEAIENKTELDDATLCQLYYEHLLRAIYIEYVDLLGSWSNDNLDYFKKLAISITSDCLIDRPEREENLLSLLINKIGDPSAEISKHTIQSILKIAKKHSNMTPVIFNEVQQYISHLPPTSLYFYISLLNKLIFTYADMDFITSLLKLYFSLFKQLSKATSDTNKNSILTLLLRGINSIVANLDPSALETAYGEVSGEISLLFRLGNSESFKVKVEALRLVYGFVKADGALEDRLWRMLYKVIGEMKGAAAVKLDSLFSLIFKVIKRDCWIERVIAMLRRLLQVGFANEISFIAAVLLLINEILKHRKELRGIIFRSWGFGDDEEEVFVDADKQKKRKKKAKKKVEEQKEEQKDEDKYDPSARDPKFAKADKEVFWEFNVLRSYYHPTIRIWVQELMDGKEIKYSGDPLQDFSMGNFLDKIILKPAKSSEKLQKMKFKRNRNARAEEIKEAVKTNFEEEEDFDAIKTKITKSGEFRADEEFLYKHLLLKSKKDKQERQRQLDKSKKKAKVQEEDEDMDALDAEVENFEMSDGEELSEGFFGDEEGVEDVDVDQNFKQDGVFQEAPSDSE